MVPTTSGATTAFACYAAIEFDSTIGVLWIAMSFRADICVEYNGSHINPQRPNKRTDGYRAL